MINIYIVTRMSENKNDVPNLGVFLSQEKAETHFDNIVEDRRGINRNYQCEIAWVIERYPKEYDFNNVIKEAYIKHPKTEYQNEYVEMLRIELYTEPVEDLFIEKI